MATAFKKKFSSLSSKIREISSPLIGIRRGTLSLSKTQKLSKLLKNSNNKKRKRILKKLKRIEAVITRAKSGKLILQKNIIHAIGKVYLDPSRRYLPRNDYYITRDQILDFYKKLEPGDIITQSRKWRSSNVGIRGFWKHTVLYVGTFEELDKYFEKETKKLFGKKFSQHTKEKYPDLYYDKLLERDGVQSRTIESLAQGVVMLGIQRPDYIAAIRPRVSKTKKMLAILNTFKQYKKPYDYTFDFFNDDMLVCSELVAKSYLPDKGSEDGLDFDITWNPTGRWVLKTNDIVKQFEKDYKTNKQQFDFVGFLDRGKESDIYAFMDSYKRQIL